MTDESTLLKMKPLNDLVLIDWDLATNEYGRSKLIRPDNYKLMHYTGKVVSVGPDVRADFDVGDRIFFDRFCRPKTFYFPGTDKRYAIIHSSDVLAKVAERRVA